MSFSALRIRPPYSHCLKLYFEKVFPTGIRSGSRGFLSLEHPASWLTSKSWELYQEHTSRDSNVDDTESCLVICCTRVEILSQYRDFLLPAGMRSHPAFALDRPEGWVCVSHLKAFLAAVAAGENLGTFTALGVETSPQRYKKEKLSGQLEMIEFSTVEGTPEMDEARSLSSAGSPFHPRTPVNSTGGSNLGREPFVWAPIPRPFTSVAQLEIGLGPDQGEDKETHYR